MMWIYMVRRVLYAIPILLGVNLLTFTLFFVVNSPDDMARMHLGHRHVTEAAIESWKVEHGYNQPLFYNKEAGGIKAVTETLLVKKSLDLFLFDFGESDQGRSIGHDIKERMMPSLAFAVPVLFLGLSVNITLALLLTLFRGKWIDLLGVGACVVLMSVSGLFYIIVGQYLFAQVFRLVPVSGYMEGLSSIRFLALPIFIGVLGGIGMGTRWYRTIFLEQYPMAFVRTAQAKGLSEWHVLSRHILRAGLIPILTGVVVVIPTLFLGSLLMESFFSIPGLGSYTIDAIAAQDFDIVRVMVFLGTLMYIVGLILTDLSYAWVDPRIRIQ